MFRYLLSRNVIRDPWWYCIFGNVFDHFKFFHWCYEKDSRISPELCFDEVCLWSAWAIINGCCCLIMGSFYRESKKLFYLHVYVTPALNSVWDEGINLFRFCSYTRLYFMTNWIDQTKEILRKARFHFFLDAIILVPSFPFPLFIFSSLTMISKYF